MDRQKYLKDTGGIGKMQVEELLDKAEQSGKESYRLFKVARWWRAATWRFVMHHSETIDEAEKKMQRFEMDAMMGKEEVEAFEQALKEKKCQSTKQ